jgi:hypothetical protein
MPGRWPWLPDCSVWRSGSVRHRHGLRRLRCALHVPAVSASAIALTSADLALSTTALTTTFPAATVPTSAVTTAGAPTSITAPT